MSIQAVAWALEQHIPRAPLKLVLIAICNHADKDDGQCFPSIRTIEHEASMSRSSVQRCVKELARLGYVEIMPSFDDGGRQNANTYRVVFDAEQRRSITCRDDEGGCQNDTPESGENTAERGVRMTPGSVTADTGEGVTADTPSRTIIKNPTPLPPRARDPGFCRLLDGWVKSSRPDNVALAEQIFLSLPADIDRNRAIEMSPLFQRIQIRRRRKPKLIAYLRAKAWRDLVGAPDIDADGQFVITPDREEWDAWISDIRAKFGGSGEETSRRQKRIVREHRWPPVPGHARQDALL